MYMQMVESAGPPPWVYTDDDVYCDKLLGDVAIFIARETGIDQSLLDAYLSHLQAPIPTNEEAEVADSSSLVNKEQFIRDGSAVVEYSVQAEGSPSETSGDGMNEAGDSPSDATTGVVDLSSSSDAVESEAEALPPPKASQLD